MERLARSQNRRREIWMVGRIREMLCLQAKTVTLFVDVPLFPGDRPIQKISRVKLHPRLSCKDFQNSSAGWFMHPCSQIKTVVFPVDHKVVVVAASHHQLFV